MNIILTPIEARVLGSLIEKETTTPEYYPLTLNALTSACNQKSNREPVMELDEKTVVRAIESLRDKRLVMRVSGAGARVPKYRHDIPSVFNFSAQQLSLIGVLMLRGPQTAGELRTRTGRLYEFDDLAKVETTLEELMKRDDGPYVVKLPREAGRREQRYAHLFCGEVKFEESEIVLPLEKAALAVQAENERIAALEREVTTLRNELDDLKQRFEEFVKQFE